MSIFFVVSGTTIQAWHALFFHTTAFACLKSILGASRTRSSWVMHSLNQQIGPIPAGFLHCLLRAPTANLFVVAADQHFRHIPSAKRLRPRVMRIIQNPALVQHGSLGAVLAALRGANWPALNDSFTAESSFPSAPGISRVTASRIMRRRQFASGQHESPIEISSVARCSATRSSTPSYRPQISTMRSSFANRRAVC